MDNAAGEQVSSPYPQTKAELMERINWWRTALEDRISRLDEEQLTKPGTDGWSIKDHLAHIAIWEQSLIALLEGRCRYEAMGIDAATYESGDVDAMNAQIYEHYREHSLAEVVDTFRRSHTQLLEVLARLTDADLSKPYSHYLPDDPPYNPNPVIQWIAGDTYEHYQEHYDWMSPILGDEGDRAG